MNEKSIETLQKEAADFNIGGLIGKPWSEINDIINKHKDNGFILEKLHKSKKFQKYCQEQADHFLKRRIALTQKDFEAVRLLWLYGDLELDEILIIKDRINDDDYIRSDRFRDFDKDKTMRLFAENIPDIQEELEVPGHLVPQMRLNQRQRLVDFVRFMESGRKSKELIKKGDWKALSEAFEHFPRMKTEAIIDLYKASVKENPDSERAHMMSRIFICRLYDIDDGKWELKNSSELDAIENIIKENYNAPESDAFISRILAKISETRETLSNKSKKNALPLIIDEEITQEDTIQNDFQQKQESEVSQNSEELKQTKDSKEEIKEEIKKDNIKDNIEKEPLKENSEPLSETEKEKTEKESVSAGQKEEKNWQEETLNSWKDWAKGHHKRIETYEPETAPKDLAFKIYPSNKEADKEKFEADIHYKEANHMVVKGKPGNEVFEGIVAMAKKNGNQIIFGNIKSDEFKARLLLACLKDSEIEMTNAPKIDDLQDIPEDLKEALHNQAKQKTGESKGKIESQSKDKDTLENDDKSRSERRGGNREHRPFNKNRRNGEKRPRREFTEEEKKAYRERKIREAALHSH